MFFNLFLFTAPLRSLKNLAAHFETLCSKTSIKRQVIPNSVAPLTPICGTLVCRGTPVGNHCSTSYSLSIFLYVKACICFFIPHLLFLFGFAQRFHVKIRDLFSACICQLRQQSQKNSPIPIFFFKTDAKRHMGKCRKGKFRKMG